MAKLRRPSFSQLEMVVWMDRGEFGTGTGQFLWQGAHLRHRGRTRELETRAWESSAKRGMGLGVRVFFSLHAVHPLLGTSFMVKDLRYTGTKMGLDRNDGGHYHGAIWDEDTRLLSISGCEVSIKKGIYQS